MGTIEIASGNIKTHCLSNLDKYLVEFEENALINGAIVHWAKDADEHNKIVGEILNKHKIKKIVKSKSMLTEECELNPYLEKNGIDVIDTDLGDRIIQLRNEPPSHIVLPAIHIKKEEVSELFHEKWDTSDYSYGVFISEPSKTADIEQTLVVGAQGPKRMLVLCY